jgi:hypothetical protein
MLGLFFYNIFNLINKKISIIYIYFVFISLIFSIIGLYFLYINYPFLFEFGFFAHLKGLYNYINSFVFIGYGLGLSGSFSVIENPLEIGIESSFANIFSQLGIIGAMIIVLYFQWINRKVRIKNIFQLLLVFYFFIYLTSNSATGYSGNFLIIFIFAYFIKQNYYRKVST